MWKMWNAEKSIYKENVHNVNHEILTFDYEKEPWLKQPFLKKVMCVKSPSLSHSHHFFFLLNLCIKSQHLFSVCGATGLLLLRTTYPNRWPVCEIEHQLVINTLKLKVNDECNRGTFASIRHLLLSEAVFICSPTRGGDASALSGVRLQVLIADIGDVDFLQSSSWFPPQCPSTAILLSSLWFPPPRHCTPSLYLPCLRSISYLPPVYLSPPGAGVEINHWFVDPHPPWQGFLFSSSSLS